MGGSQEKKAGRENGIIESGYLVAHNQKLVYLHLSWQLLLSDFPSIPMISGGLSVLKPPSNSKAKRFNEMDEMCVCVQMCVYI